MNKSNKKKSDQLGIPFGTAMGRLRKKILFELVKQLDQDVCCRCGDKIETTKEFTIDHKKAWLDSEDPQKLFSDLNNIAFSHLKCNIQAGRRNKIICPEGYSWCWKCKRMIKLKYFPEKYIKSSGIKSACTECSTKMRSKYKRIRN